MLPDGDQIAGRNRRRREFLYDASWHRGYRLVCKACGAVMEDVEPCVKGGEHWHPTHAKNPKTGVREPSKCPHAGERVVSLSRWRTSKPPSRWVEVFQPKKVRRGRAQARKKVRRLHAR
jgi:hypothetical protein